MPATLGVTLVAVLVLAIDTSTAALITGLVRVEQGAELVEETVIEDTRAHNELLVPTVRELLARAKVAFADIDAFVVGCGPGPFTGLRVGMATAAAFGDALGKPVHGVCSLDAAAWLLHAPAAVIATDARRKEVYWARYRGGRRVEGPGVCKPEALVIGEEVLSIPEGVRAVSTGATYQLPLALGLVAVADLAATPGPLEPLYLRRPDAKEPKPLPRSRAIPEIDVTGLEG